MDLSKFTYELAQKDSKLLWLLAKSDAWTSALASKLKLLLKERTFILICDDERTWFEEYFLKNINKSMKERPFLPFFSLSSLYPNRKNLKNFENFPYLDDMLNLSFPKGYVYFYIGESKGELYELAKSSEDSYMWIIEKEGKNAFYLDKDDEDLDIKLLTLYKAFNKSLDAALFSEVLL